MKHVQNVIKIHENVQDHVEIEQENEVNNAITEQVTELIDYVQKTVYLLILNITAEME